MLPAGLTCARRVCIRDAPTSTYDPSDSARYVESWISVAQCCVRKRFGSVPKIDGARPLGIFENRAQVTWTDGTTPGSANSNYADISVIAEPSFKLTKDVDQSNAGPGDELTYTISLREHGRRGGRQHGGDGHDSGGVNPGGGLVPGCDLCAGRDGLRSRHPHLVVGQCSSFCDGVADLQGHGRCGHTPRGSLVNLAAMTADNVFGAVVATAKTAINVAGVIDLVASKTLQSGAAQYVGDGDSIAYDLSITNNGNAVASNVLLVDPLPKGTTLDTSLSPGWSLVGNNLELSLPDIPGQSSSATYPLVLTVDGSQLTDGDVIFNQATGSGTETGGQTDSAVTGLVSVTYNAPPTVSVVKRAIPLESVPQFPGDEINYTIEATLETITGVSDLQVAICCPRGWSTSVRSRFPTR